MCLILDYSLPGTIVLCVRKKSTIGFSVITSPSIAQLVERWTVVEVVIHRSLVQIRLEGFFSSSFYDYNYYNC